MNIPGKAIIYLGTKEAALRLEEFTQKHMDRDLHVDGISNFEDIYCDLDGGPGDQLPIGSKSDYETWIKNAEEGNQEYIKFIPEEDYLRFISVDDFIALCSVAEIEEDVEDIDISSIF